MSWVQQQYWVGERIATMTYVRRYTANGWYLLPKDVRAISCQVVEWDWGADTYGAHALAYTLLLDAFGSVDLAAALRNDFCHGPIGLLQVPTWSYKMADLLSWVQALLEARALSIQKQEMPGFRRFDPQGG